jgi:ATP-binding cassette subfamily C protein CydD
LSRQRPTFKRTLYLWGATASTVGARLALFTALVSLVRPSFPIGITHAPSIAAAAAMLGIVRNLLRGELTRAELELGWSRMVESVRSRSIVALSAPETRDRAAQMVDAIYEVAVGTALVVPELVAAAVTSAAVLGAAAFTLGPAWTSAGLVGGLLLLVLLAPARRALRQSRARSWSSQVLLGAGLEGLVAGALELRAHACEQRFSEQLLVRSRALALEERLASRLGMWTAALPAGLAVALPLMPVSLREELSTSQGATLAVLAGALFQAVITAFGALTARAKVAPLKRAILAFEGQPEQTLRPAAMEPPANPGSVEFHDVSVRYDGGLATPYRLSFVARLGGVALIGANGAGKSTALLALLGLVPLDAGEIRRSHGEVAGRSVAFLPQRPYIALEETIAWHLGVMGTRAVPDGDIERGLRKVGLWDRLERRARAHAERVGELRMGGLSGGERQRVMLARLLLTDGTMLLLDEPEAALDHEGRLLLAGLLAEEASRRSVIVVAHDETVIPETFQRIQVDAEARPKAANADDARQSGGML